MKYGRLIVALALVFFMVGCACEKEAPAPGFTAEDKAAINGLLDSFVVSINAQDWVANASYYETDAVRMPPNAPMIQGHAAFIASWEALPPITGFTLTPQVVAGDGDLAYARGAFTLDLAPPDAEAVNMVGKWHAIYKRQADGSWLCTSDIWNEDTPIEM